MSGHPLPEPDEDDRKIAALDQTFFQSSAMIRLESISNFAQSLWKSLMIVNGGAIVALFTLIGNSDLAVDKFWLWWAFLTFAIGLGATLLSNFGAYVTQSAYWQHDMSGAWNAQEQMHGRPPKWVKEVAHSSSLGTMFEWGALGSAILALAAFLVGSWCALKAVIPSSNHLASSAIVSSSKVPSRAKPQAPHSSPPDRKPLSVPPEGQPQAH